MNDVADIAFKGPSVTNRDVLQVFVHIPPDASVSAIPAHPTSLGAGCRFGVILADPPWQYDNGGGGKHRGGVDAEYATRGNDWICSLPVSELAAKDAVLLLWATNPKIPEAVQAISAWGFTYKTMFTWAKMTRAAAPRVGIGYHARSCTEHLMVATKGKVAPPLVEDRRVGLIFCPIGRHSAKPDHQYEIAEAYEGPYLELFHRPRDGMFPPREGWTFMGNECPGNLDIRDAIAAATQERDAILQADAPTGGEGR